MKKITSYRLKITSQGKHTKEGGTHMKKIMLFISIIAIALFITACGDNNDNDNGNNNNASDNVTDNQNNAGDTDADNNGNTNGNNQNANQDDSDNNSTDDMQAKMDELDYDEIEIEVDYGKDKEYEIEIEQDEGQPIEAKIEDEVNDVFLKGEEAFNELYPMVKELSIDKDTDKETAIQDVLDTFDLDDDYDEFELEITLNDGSKIEHEDK